MISAAFMAFYSRFSVSIVFPIPAAVLVDERVLTYGQILLVGKDQQDGISQLILVQHALKFLSGLDDTISVVAVDNEDDTLGVLEVVSPQGTDLVLTTDIPHGELDVLVLNSLDVEA